MDLMETLDYIYQLENSPEQEAKDNQYFNQVEQEWYEKHKDEADKKEGKYKGQTVCPDRCPTQKQVDDMNEYLEYLKERFTLERDMLSS
jgi:DNA/RNA endonuclease YhcR with UshA esterase domain